MDGVLVRQTGRENFHLMNWMDGGKELWQQIKDKKPTLLSRLPDAYLAKGYKQKRIWVDSNLGKEVPLLVVADSFGKHPYCEAGDYLIDDSAEMCEKWRQRGGIAIQWPHDKELVIRG